MTVEQKKVVKDSLVHLAMIWTAAFLIIGPICYVTKQTIEWDAFFFYTTLGAIFGELVLRKR